MAEKIADLWPVLFRAALYFGIPFLASMGDKIGPILEKDQWPSPQRWVLSVIVGSISGGVALRAYFDGSAQRHSDARNGNGHGMPMIPPK